MKISEMSKSELADYMRNVTHEIGLPDGRYRFDHTPTWKRVFKLAKQNGYENLEMDCGKCIDKAAKWIAG